MRVKPIAHGTHAGYMAKCRCEDCREAQKLYIREYRLRKRAGTFVSHNKIRYGRPLASDNLARRVGPDFPAVGTIARSLAVSAA